MKKQILKKFIVLVIILTMIMPSYNFSTKAASSTQPKLRDCVGYVDDQGINVECDTLYLGEYYQSNDRNMEPIKWLVLKVEGDKALIVSEKNLECMPFTKFETATEEDDFAEVISTEFSWRDSDVRKWLNETFYDTAFSKRELSAIISTEIKYKDDYPAESFFFRDTDDDGEHWELTGYDTTDNIFLLSEKEVRDHGGFFLYSHYLSHLDDNKYYKDKRDTTDSRSEYMTRTMYGLTYYSGTYINRRYLNIAHYYSAESYGSNYVFRYSKCQSFSVRPAMYIDVNSTAWKYAGRLEYHAKDGTIPPSQQSSKQSGITCNPEITIKSGSSMNINARLFATLEEKLYENYEEVEWNTSDSSVVNVVEEGAIWQTTPSLYKMGDVTCSLWWAYQNVYAEGVKEGTATITGTLADGTRVTCNVTVEKGPDDVSREGNGGSFTLGADKEGKADADSGVSQFFPKTWSMKSSMFPVQIKSVVSADGSYTIRGLIGIGSSNWLDDDAKWDTITSSIDKAKRQANRNDVLDALCKDAVPNTILTSKEWKSKNPSLTVVGYIENKYDKNGNLLSASGNVNGELDKGASMSWMFATPIGPLYLRLDAKCGLVLDGGVKYDYVNKKASFDGTLELSPTISLTGGYGIDNVASISATGSLGVNMTLSKGTFTANAKVNAYLFYLIDYSQTLAKYSTDLWNDSASTKSTMKKGLTVPKMKEPASTLSKNILKSKSNWSGNLDTAKTNDYIKLQEEILVSSTPQCVEVGNKSVMVWQDYDSGRTTANSTVLKYSVLENNTWSNPQVVYDNGTGDFMADMKVLNGKLYLTWQKSKQEITTDDVDEMISEISKNAEIYYAEFDYDNNTFTNIKALTDNNVCDIMPQIVEDGDDIYVTYVRNDANDIEQKEGYTSIYYVSPTSKREKKLVESAGTINNYVSYFKDDEVKALYVTSQNDVNAILNSDNVPVDSLNCLDISNTKGTFSSFDYHNDFISFVNNGVLYEYDVDAETVNECSAGGEAFRDNMAYFNNATQEGYLWSEYDEENQIGYIKASVKAEDGYTSPVVVYTTDNKVSRYISPVLDEDGSLYIVSNTEDFKEDKHSLDYISTTLEGKTYTVYIDGTEDETVAVDETYTLPGDAKYGYYDATNHKLYKPSSTITLKEDISLESIDDLTVSTQKGASMQLSYPTGIRFATNIKCSNDNLMKEKDIVSCGTLITLSDYVINNGGQFDKSCTYQKIDVIDSGDRGNDYTYSASIVGIKENNYRTEYMARGYVTLKYADDTEQIIYSPYSNVVSRSIFTIAMDIYTNTTYFNSLSEEEQNIILSVLGDSV